MYDNMKCHCCCALAVRHVKTTIIVCLSNLVHYAMYGTVKCHCCSFGLPVCVLLENISTPACKVFSFMPPRRWEIPVKAKSFFLNVAFNMPNPSEFSLTLHGAGMDIF